MNPASTNLRFGPPGWRSSLMVVLSLALCAAACAAATLEEQILSRLSEIRAVRTDQGPTVVAAYNKSMDATWHLVAENSIQAMPILRRELSAETALPQPNNLLLLDIGLLLYKNDAEEGRSIARNALFRLDPQSQILQWNIQELFEFVHSVAEDRDARVLPLIDTAFLRSETKVEVPQHAMTLDGTLICVFLFGAYGSGSESYLKAKMSDTAVTIRVLEILGWLGSPAAVPEVREALAVSPNYEVLLRATTYMMQMAGLEGRRLMPSVDPGLFDERSRQFLAKVRGAIEATSYSQLRLAFGHTSMGAKLSDAEVSARLTKMAENYGNDDNTSPLAILDSGLGSDALISQLLEVRRRTLFRVSDEALGDAQTTNALLNALRYRGK